MPFGRGGRRRAGKTSIKIAMVHMERVLLVFVGGGLGATSRYVATMAAARLWGTSFPWGTLSVNLAGCFLIGALFALGEKTEWVGPSARLFLMTGFLGGLTTFSAFGLETANAAGSGLGMALANVAANNVGGLLLVAAGMWVVKALG